MNNDLSAEMDNTVVFAEKNGVKNNQTAKKGLQSYQGSGASYFPRFERSGNPYGRGNQQNKRNQHRS